MIPPDDALRIVLERAQPIDGTEDLPIERACRRVLAEDVLADRDIPSFDRVCMDGFAFQYGTLQPGDKSTIIVEARAGYEPDQPVAAGQVARVMTGAPMPAGADTVVPIENASVDGASVIFDELPRAGRHVAPFGSECRAGTPVLAEGSVLTPTGVATLAAVGRETVRVRRQPSIAILATGDEIVRPSSPVGPGQIRDSNSYSLASQARLAGYDQIVMTRARDERDELNNALTAALESDLVIISGGVSFGQYDLVPEALAACGVEEHFHEVAQKPAKPLWFGSTDSALVFGAPGNPLATVLTFDRYILPALRKSSGLPTRRAELTGRLTRAVSAKKGDRQTFFFAEARVTGDGSFEVRPLFRTGAADVFSTVNANAVFRLQPGAQVEEGSSIKFVMMGVFEGAF